MRSGKCSLGHSRHPELICHQRAEAFREDRALDVRSRPESEALVESGTQLPVRGLSIRTEFVYSNPKVWISFRPLEKCARKGSILRFLSKVTVRLLLEVAVTKPQVEQKRNSEQMPEAWWEFRRHNHSPERSYP